MAAKIVAVLLVFVGLFLIVWVGFGAWVGKDGIWSSEGAFWWFAVLPCFRSRRRWRNVCSHLRLTSASSGTVQKWASPAFGELLKLQVSGQGKLRS